jgi:hypothetical protein
MSKGTSSVWIVFVNVGGLWQIRKVFAKGDYDRAYRYWRDNKFAGSKLEEYDIE